MRPEFLVSNLCQNIAMANNRIFAERIIEPVIPVQEVHTLRNAKGIPVLGEVDLEQIAPAALTKVLSDFLCALWSMFVL